MEVYFIIIIILSIIIFFTKSKSSKIIYIKKLFLPVIAVVFILCLIAFSDTAVKSASKGITLWLNVVFPSLFPFFVGAEILKRTGIIRAVGVLLEPIMRPIFNVPGCASFAFAMGITSGYPVGAKITKDMREDKLLSKTEAERLLAFSNNSGPLFIVGAVSVGMFNQSGLGLFLLASHIAACITVGILFRFYGKRVKGDGSQLTLFLRQREPSPRRTSSDLGSIFGDAIRNSINMMLVIGGFIIFFSVIINLLLDIGLINYLSNILSVLFNPIGIKKEILESVISGFFEITTGTSMASKASNVPYIQQLTAASIIIGWAGLSVHSQVLSIISKSDISIKPYLFGKLLQGLISGLYTYLTIKIAGPFFLTSRPAFAQISEALEMHWHNYLFSSCKFLFMTLLALSICIILHSIFGYFFKGRYR